MIILGVITNVSVNQATVPASSMEVVDLNPPSDVLFTLEMGGTRDKGNTREDGHVVSLAWPREKGDGEHEIAASSFHSQADGNKGTEGSVIVKATSKRFCFEYFIPSLPPPGLYIIWEGRQFMIDVVERASSFNNNLRVLLSHVMESFPKTWETFTGLKEKNLELKEENLELREENLQLKEGNLSLRKEGQRLKDEMTRMERRELELCKENETYRLQLAEKQSHMQNLMAELKALGDQVTSRQLMKNGKVQIEDKPSNSKA
ncbi:uncharacterized protein G2W53_033851 [Senna tora]|uniref:Uncharacterized protein n=1 Tax=Senna tora TaxID=362788 RepID=A0A834SZ96_9FABA|nr:uncharacterized protein G2W53_033851 [Senna tora]